MEKIKFDDKPKHLISTNTPTSIKDLLTIDEYSKVVGKTIRTVYNWISEGKLKTTELFGKTLVNRNERPTE